MSTNTEVDDRRTGFKDGDIVADFSQFHGRLESKLNELAARVPENYEMAVEFSPGFDGRDKVSIIIDSDDWIGNKGEIGDMRFHIILGPRGGLSTANSRRALVEGTTDYVAKNGTKGAAWDELLRAIERAK